MGGIFALAACDAAPTEPLAAPDGAQESSALAPGDASIVDIVVASSEADAEFTLLRAAIEYITATNDRSALLARLADRSQVTVFAPTDQAFVDLVTAVGNTANIVAADVSASNGIVHVIDAVILPVDLGL